MDTYEDEESREAMWLDNEDVKPLIAELGTYLAAHDTQRRRFQQIATNPRYVEGTLVRALSGIAGGLGGVSRASAYIGAAALRLLCSFSPPIVGEELLGMFQSVLSRLCISCGGDAVSASSRGWELFICAGCAQTQLVPLDGACAELQVVPRTALPTMLIPPYPADRAVPYTLRIFVDSVAAIERRIASGTSPRPVDCFPPSLATMLPPPGESTKDPIFKALPDIVDSGVRRLLYELREQGGDAVRATIETVAASAVAQPSDSEAQSARPVSKSRASSGSGGHVGDAKLSRCAASKVKLRKMGARWSTVRSHLSDVSIAAAVIWKRKEALPGPLVMERAASGWNKFLTIKEDSLPDSSLPDAVKEAVRQLTDLTKLLARASASTDQPQLVVARTLQDKGYNGLSDVEVKKKKKKKVVVTAAAAPVARGDQPAPLYTDQ